MVHASRHSQEEIRDPLPPRDRMVRSAAQLIRRKGVAGTGMREIVAQAEAPRGSLQHYFPEGKEELVGEALAWMGDVATRRVGRHLGRMPDARPSQLLAALTEDWKRDLSSEAFSAGCPLVAAAADVSATSERLRAVIENAFDGWQERLTTALADLGVDAGRAPSLASLAICSLEGAIILSRIRRDLIALDAVVDELGPVLDAAAGYQVTATS